MDNSDPSQLSDDQFLALGGSFPNVFDMGNLQTEEGPSPNQLVRRSQNNQLTTRGHPASNPQEYWYSNDSTNAADSAVPIDEDEEEIERRAEIAKRDSLSKRPAKQIPPFIQKLSSFLNNNRNTELIRWSDSGRSFVVLDEDEFARTLIPELFKHQNYASFVRQLNMYGFHKKVGLSDNSMRASEKKAKTPSEYEHQYFRRDRPNFLWLINKPKHETHTTKKRKKENDQDESEEEERHDIEDTSKGLANRNNVDAIELPRNQWATIQKEVQQLRKSQQQINSMIAQFRNENHQYIRQASAQHERHENSINAILTFLATFYSRSLDGNGNVPNIFNTIPNNQPQGNVVDVGDYEEAPVDHQNQLQRQFRRPLALLPPPLSEASPQSAQSPQTNIASPPSRSTSAQQQTTARSRPSGQILSNIRNNVPASKTSSNRTTASPDMRDSPQPHSTQDQPKDFNYDNNSKQQQQKQAALSTDMMSVIHNANANLPATNNGIDFPNALRHFETSNGNAPLTTEQRDNVLSMMANTSGASTPIGNALLSNTSGALSNPYFDVSNQFAANKEQIDMLQRLQQEQDSKVQTLADRLQPLSPNGSIPGLAMPGSSPNYTANPPSDFDLNNYVNTDYFQDFDTAQLADDPFVAGFDFNAAPDAQGGAPREVDNASLFGSEAATPQTVGGGSGSEALDSALEGATDATPANNTRKKRKTRGST